MKEGRPLARIVCLPYAGGSGWAFHRTQAPSGTELVGMDYPGHQARLDELPASSLGVLADQLHRELDAVWDVPVILLGVSLGAIVAFELALRAEAAGRPPAVLLAVSSVAPDRVAVRRTTHLSDDEFIQAHD